MTPQIEALLLTNAVSDNPKPHPIAPGTTVLVTNGNGHPRYTAKVIDVNSDTNYYRKGYMYKVEAPNGTKASLRHTYVCAAGAGLASTRLTFERKKAIAESAVIAHTKFLGQLDEALEAIQQGKQIWFGKSKRVLY